MSKNKWPLVGNEHITDFLDKILERKKVFGSYIFQGMGDLGKFTTANVFAKSLLCHNPVNGFYCGDCYSCKLFVSNRANKSEMNRQIVHGDLHVVSCSDDKKKISIEQIRNFIKSLNMSSFLGGHKIGIVKEAEKMSIEAFNALLKTLEEPKKDVVVILLTSDIDRFPETIVSRSQVLNFGPVKFDDIYDYLVHDFQVSREKAKEYARLSLGRPALALKFFDDSGFYSKHEKLVETFLNFSQQNISDRLLSIEELVGKKMSGQTAVRDVEDILNVWLSCMRDQVLASYGHVELLQNSKFQNKIKKYRDSKEVLNCYYVLKKARKYLGDNVNPKLVLDSVAANFSL